MRIYSLIHSACISQEQQEKNSRRIAQRCAKRVIDRRQVELPSCSCVAELQWCCRVVVVLLVFASIQNRFDSNRCCSPEIIEYGCWYSRCSVYSSCHTAKNFMRNTCFKLPNDHRKRRWHADQPCGLSAAWGLIARLTWRAPRAARADDQSMDTTHMAWHLLFTERSL